MDAVCPNSNDTGRRENAPIPTIRKIYSKGKLPRDIVKNLGIDPNILGDTRINGLKTMIGNEVKKGNGFRDLNTYAQGCNGYLSAENRIKY